MRFPFLLAIPAIVAAAPLAAEPQLGAPAPDFRLTGADGRTVQLSAYRGRTVVLEWTNPDCPYVRKHYGSGNMQRAQARALSDGAVWLTINSGAPGKQGHLTPAAARQLVRTAKSRTNAYLLDPRGVVGRAYRAVTTPHLYIIDPAGRLVYRGGIDDRATSDPADIDGARNHVLAALGELKAGRAVSVPDTRPYGCTVKYAS